MFAYLLTLFLSALFMLQIVIAGNGTLETSCDVDSILVTTGELCQSAYSDDDEYTKNAIDPAMLSTQNNLNMS